MKIFISNTIHFKYFSFFFTLFRKNIGFAVELAVFFFYT